MNEVPDMSNARQGLGAGPPHLAPQRRARWAWEEVAKVPKAQAEKYSTLARRLPSLLQVSGLGQTMAFLAANAKPPDKKEGANAERVLLDQLSEYLGQVMRKERRGLDPLDLVTSLSPMDYRRASWEAQALAQWLKRFAESVFRTE